jgi:hypothetical protein
MEHQGSLPCSQGPSTGPYHEPDESSPYRPTYHSKIHSGIHPTYPMGTPGVKWSGPEADHSPPASAEVKKTWVYTPTPLYAFMA